MTNTWVYYYIFSKSPKPYCPGSPSGVSPKVQEKTHGFGVGGKKTLSQIHTYTNTIPQPVVVPFWLGGIWSRCCSSEANAEVS